MEKDQLLFVVVVIDLKTMNGMIHKSLYIIFKINIDRESTRALSMSKKTMQEYRIDCRIQ